MDGQALGRQFSYISVLQILRAGSAFIAPGSKALNCSEIGFNCLTALLLYCNVKGAGFYQTVIQTTFHMGVKY